VHAAAVSLHETKEAAMRKRNLVIAIVTGLGLLGAALALVLAPPTTEAQTTLTDRYILYEDIESTYVHLLGQNMHFLIAGTSATGTKATRYDQNVEEGVHVGVALGIDASDAQRWLANKCISMARKVAAQPNKYDLRFICSAPDSPTSAFHCSVDDLVICELIREQ
jgi:hypothetical protein